MVVDVPPAGEEVPPPHAVVVARGARATQWGPFSYSSVWDRGSNAQIGWGANCKRHHDPFGSTSIYQNGMTYGKEKFSDQYCILQLKRWLYRGYYMTADELGENPRASHVRNVDARTIDGPDEATLDAWAASLPL